MSKKILNWELLINKLLGEEDSSPLVSTDVHSFYHDVFITDLNKEINTISEEATSYKVQISEQSILIDKLQKEIQHLNKVLNRYRNNLNELSKKDKTILKPENLKRMEKQIKKSTFMPNREEESVRDDESNTIDITISRPSSQEHIRHPNRHYSK